MSKTLLYNTRFSENSSVESTNISLKSASSHIVRLGKNKTVKTNLIWFALVEILFYTLPL